MRKWASRITILMDVVSIFGFGYTVVTVATAFLAPSRIAIGQSDIFIFGVSFKWLLLAVVAALLGNVRAAWGRLERIDMS